LAISVSGGDFGTRVHTSRYDHTTREEDEAFYSASAKNDVRDLEDTFFVDLQPDHSIEY